jgi:hypothetical protein
MKPFLFAFFGSLIFCAVAFPQGPGGTTLMTGSQAQIKIGQLTITSSSNPLLLEVASEQSGVIIKGVGSVASGANPFKYGLLKVLDTRVYASDSDYSPLASFAYATPPTSPGVLVFKISTGLNGGVNITNEATLQLGGDLIIRNQFTLALGTGTNAGKLVVREPGGLEHPLW